MTAKTAKLHITPDGFGSTIEVEGHQLEAVRSIVLTAAVDNIPRLTVDLLTHEVEADGEFTIDVPDRTAATLRALGWTPPAADGERAPGWEAFEQLVRDVHRTTVWPEPHVAGLIAEAARARAEADRLRAERDANVGVLAAHLAKIERLESEKAEFTALHPDEWAKVETLAADRNALAAEAARLHARIDKIRTIEPRMRSRWSRPTTAQRNEDIGWNAAVAEVRTVLALDEIDDVLGIDQDGAERG